MSNENKCGYMMSQEVQNMCTVAQGPNHGPAPLPHSGLVRFSRGRAARDPCP